MSTNKYISDELLASFIDGNTTQEQSKEMMKFLCDSPDAFEEFHIASMAVNSIETEIEHNMNPNLDLWGTAAIIGSGGVAAKLFDDIFQHSPHMAALSEENSISNDRFNVDDDSNTVNNEIIYRAPSITGPNTSLGFIEQSDDLLHVARCQQHILHQYGIERNEEELVSAIKKDWGDDNGSLYNVGGLLEKFDIPVTRYENANVITAAKELAEGHSVVIVVDSRNLWEAGFWEGSFESTEDMLLDKPDHSFVIAGINTMNPLDVRIEISEVKQNGVKLDYSFDEFIDLWRNSNFFMVSTDQAMPNYNPEMANFDYSYLGRISNVGGLPYPEFEILYDLSMTDASDTTFLNQLVDTYCLASDSEIYFPKAVKELSVLSFGETNIADSTMDSYIDNYHLNDILSESINSYHDYYCAMEGYFEQLGNTTGSDFSSNIDWYNEQQNLI